MIVRRVLLEYSDDFKKLSHTLRFIVHHRRNQWSRIQSYSGTLMVSRNYPTHWDSQHNTPEINGSDYNCVRLSRRIEETISEIEIHGTLDKNCVILRTVLFNYSHDLKNLFHALQFMGHCLRNDRFPLEFCSATLMISRNYSTHWEL